MARNVRDMPIEVTQGDLVTRYVELGDMAIRHATLPAGTDMLPSRKADAGSHFAFVLEGKVRITMSDGGRYDLGAGDSIHIADQPPRTFANAGRRSARLLWVKDSRSEGDLDGAAERGR